MKELNLMANGSWVTGRSPRADGGQGDRTRSLEANGAARVLASLLSPSIAWRQAEEGGHKWSENFCRFHRPGIMLDTQARTLPSLQMAAVMTLLGGLWLGSWADGSSCLVEKHSG
ncbi:hypothetical protein DPEC_G00036890 [Dallia pectoralis]|uniref:Uncharacterized protein n=1 Tax=Dallia pectoralis TaxID=75939 RepID=A0ACC2HDP7_DALPE|nr:hypothetical protein DPEC_G00036890 [Dallia pectoralis]